MLRWVDPFLTLGPGCEPGVPVRPVLLNALWQLVCERLVRCLSGALLPCSCWQCLHCEREGPCFVLPASLEPVLIQGELAHTSAYSRSICWLYPPAAEKHFFHWLFINFWGRAKGFNVRFLFDFICATLSRWKRSNHTLVCGALLPSFIIMYSLLLLFNCNMLLCHFRLLFLIRKIDAGGRWGH